MKLEAVILAMVLCGLPCAAQAKDDRYVETLACIGGPFGLGVPPTYSALRKLGPIEREATAVPDGPADGKAVRRAIWFPGLVLDLYSFPDQPERYLLASATITDPRWTLAGPLHVGQTLDDARQHLAALGVTLGPSLSLGGDGDTITLKLSGNAISEIDYSCYTG